MNAIRHFKFLFAIALAWFLIGSTSAFAVGMTKGFSPNPINPGDTSMMTIIVFNDTNTALTAVGWTDNMPVDMTIQSSPLPTNSCGGTLTAVPGTSTVTLSGGSVVAQVAGVAGECSVVIPVKTSVAPGFGSTNTILAGSLVTTPAYTNAQLATTLTTNLFAAPTLSTSLDRSLIYLGEGAILTVNIINTDVTKTLTQAGWTNTLPTGLEVNGVATDNGQCGTPTITAVATTTALALSNATVAPAATCTIQIPITGNLQGNYTINFPTGIITSYQNATNASPSTQAIAVQSFNASKLFTPASVKTNQISTMSITISSKAAYSNLAFSDDFSLQTGLVVAPTPNAVITGTGCTGTVTANPGSRVVSLSAGSIPTGGTFLSPKTCTISVNVVVPSNLNIGTKTNTMAIGSITSGAASNINVASATLTVNGYTAPTLTQSLSTTTSFVGQVINLLVNVRNNDATTFTNVGWIDTLPTGLVVAGTATFSAGCTGTPLATVTLGNPLITFSGASIATGATCTATIPVTATQQGAITVTALPIGTVTNNQGTSNIVATSAPALTASTFTVVQKLNGATPTATMSLNTATKLRIEITNKSTDTYSNLTFTDNFIASGSNLPATFTVINPGNAVTTCNATGALTTITNGGAITGFTTGSTAFTFSGGFLAAGTATNVTTTCYVELDVQATAVITNGTNAISTVTALADGTGILTSGLNTAASATVANLTISAAALVAPTTTNTFTPTSVVVGGSSTLQVSVTNNDPLITLTNVTWIDTLPAGVVWTGGAITYTNCGTGSVAFDVTNSVATLGIGVSLAPMGSCTVSIPVKTTKQGVFANTLPINAAAGSVSNDQGIHNTASPTATLTSTSITAAKVFNNALGTPASIIHIGDTVTLKITVTNPSQTESYNSLAFTDSFANFTATVGGGVALQIAATPNAQTTCTAGGALTPLASVGGSAVVGAQSLSLAGGTLAANSSCDILVDVTAMALMTVKTNTIAGGTAAASTGAGITAVSNSNASQIWNAAALTANLTINTLAAPTFSAKTFAPSSIFMGANSVLTISVTNNDATTTLNNVTWTDKFPWGLVTTSAATITTPAACGAPSITSSVVAGLTEVAFAGGTIPPLSTCTFTINVTGTSAAGSYTNSIPISAITTTEGATNTVASPAPALWLEGLQMNKNFSVSPIAIGAVSRLTINVTNNTTVNHPSIVLTDDFTAQTGLVIANPPNVVSSGTGCTLGTVTATAGTGVVSLSGFALAAGTATVAKTCTVQVDVVDTIAGTKTNTILGTGLVAAPSQWTAPATANLVVSAATLTAVKTFTVSPTNVAGTILADGVDVALMRITITNPNAVALNSPSFIDTFPGAMSGLVVSNASALVNTCGGTPTATVGTNIVRLVGTVADVIAAGASCYVEVPVVSTLGFTNKTNSVTVSAKTSTAVAVSAAPATANLTANPATLTVAKTFTVSPTNAAGTILANGTDVALMRITITNPNAIALNSPSFTDTFPVAMSGLVVSNASALVNTCGGTPTATVGTSIVRLVGTVADVIAAGASCYVEVPVVSTAAFMNKANSVTVSAKTSTALNVSAAPATANLTANPLSVTHAFGVPTLIVGANTTWTITIVNNSASAQTAVQFSDTLPNSALFVDTVPTMVTTCGGTVTATAGTKVVTLAGGSIPANSSCSISVNMVGNGVGTITNNVVSVKSTQQTTAVTSNNASITVINPSVVIGAPTKAFTPATVTLLQNSTASINWKSASTAPTVDPIVTDNLPVGLTVAAVPNVTASCITPVATPVVASTTVSPTRNQIVVALTITQVKNQVCTITFDVTPTKPGTLTNTLAKGDILSADGITAANTSASNNATLTVTNVLTIGKTFQPTDLSFSGVAMLTITVTNPETTPLTGASLRDNLPATTPNDLIVAGSPYTTAVGTTDCTADGSQSTALVTATAGTRIVQLTGGVIPAKQGAVDGICHITVPVKLGSAAPTGPATNTIPVGTGVVGTGLTTTEGRYNINAATATITYVAPTLGIAKSFNPPSVSGGSVSQLTVTITNNNNFIQTGLAFADVMPVGMTVGAPANPQTTCTGGTFTGATTGSASWSFSGGVVPASGTCTVSLNVTMNVRTTLTNTIPLNALTSANGGKNNIQVGTANLTNLAGLSIAKAFTPNPAVVNQPIRLIFSITNSSDTTSLTGLGFSDDLTLGGTQTGLTVSPTPNVSNGCGGTLVASGTSISLSGGVLAAQAACTIAVDVVTNTVGSYTNTVAKLNLVSTQGLTNGNPGSDTLPVYAGIRAVKQLSPVTDAGRFVLTLSPAAPSGVSSRTNVGHDASPSAVTSFFANEGVAYTVTETGQGATLLTNYTTTWACRNADNTLLTSGSGTVATVTPPTTASGATKNQQDITCTFTNVNKVALLTVSSVSNGGVGSFTFTGDNGLPVSASTITTTSAGVAATSVALTNVSLTNKGVATVITEGALAGGFVLSGASCTGLQGADTATLVGGVLTIPVTSVVDGARINCTFTHSLPGAKTLVLRKQWSGATLNDAVSITATGLTPLASVATTAGKLDTGNAQVVTSGAVITIAETFSVGSAANYTASLACTGTTGLVGNVLTVGVADTAIVCTETNTFTGAGGSSITGKVFNDNGAGGGIANNGILDGAEVGIAGVTITANQASCASTVCGTAITDGGGNYVMSLPSSVTGVITLTETNLSGMLSTGGSVGTSGGTYTRSTDTVTAFNVVAGTSYTGVNFGDVPDNQFVTDGVQAALPGSVVFYPHYFVAGTAGNVAFSLTKVTSPANAGWSELIYVDANCNGVIDGGEVLVAASVPVVADQKVCLLVKQFVPANVPVNAQNALTLTANFTSTFSNPTGAVAFSYVRHDTTTVGQPTAAGLSLVKSVNTTTALPGANIIYTVVYTNSSSGPLSNVVIQDATPSYTTFQNANCGTLPLNFTACSIANPATGAAGAIIYTFTGTLAPAASGAVTFTVQVQP